MFRIFFLFTVISSILFSHTPYLANNIFLLPTIDAIPKKIHQIWVGKNPIPKSYQEYMKSWLLVHPDWEYKLWTDADIDNFPWINKDLFLKAKNPGMKSDIWRYEIINLYGGLYVDTDMEAIRSLESIHDKLEFYAGYFSGDCIACGIFASKPNSPILQSVIEGLRKSTKNFNFDLFDFNRLIDATGPQYFTRMINAILPNLDKSVNVIFEKPYFQPVEVKNKGIPKTAQEFYNISSICFAIDYNGCSWDERIFDQLYE